MTARPLERTAYRMLYDSIHEFKITAAHLDSEIKRCGSNGKNFAVITGMNGRTHHDIWVAMKTASHFNLGIALELMLKLLVLHTNDNSDSIPTHQSLIKLHDEIPEKYQEQLEAVFQECVSDLPNGFSSIAFLNSDSPNPVRSSLADRDRKSLSEFLEYFDQDVMLYLKRYSYEPVHQQKWHH